MRSRAVTREVTRLEATEVAGEGGDKHSPRWGRGGQEEAEGGGWRRETVQEK